MPLITSFADANAYLARYNQPADTKYDLAVMRALMAYLGNPQDKVKVVHVAGTSGKTSTAYYISALLTAAGLEVGLTVSPHVDEVNERLQVNGRLLPEAEFCRALSEFAGLVEKAPLRPSSFELKAALAFWYFAKQGLDYAVVEVGLGGLKDATNVITQSDKLCIITDIGFDHMKTLGNRLADIAEQKSGIIHPGNSVITYRQPAEAMKVLETTCKRKKAVLEIVAEAPNPDTDLPDYQWRNWSLARAAYDLLAGRDKLPGLSESQLAKTRQLIIPGRMDTRQLGGKTLVMDGAHNQQKMEAFVASFKKLYPGVKPAVLLAMRDGKEYQSVVPLLVPFASRVITTTFTGSQDFPVQCVPPEELAAAFKGRLPVKSVPGQAQAFQALLDGPEDTVVLTGSIYMLGQIRAKKHLA